MSVEENKAIAHRLFDGAWNRGDVALFDEFTTPQSIDHAAVVGKEGGVGPESFKEVITTMRTAMPDLHLTIEDEIAEGDKVVHRWRMQGTNQGPLMGMAPTGKKLTLTGITIVRIVNGKVMDRWAQIDELGLLRQLGIVPAAPA